MARRKRKRSLKRRLRNRTRSLRYAVELFLYDRLMARASRMSHERALEWGRRCGRVLAMLSTPERAILRRNLELAFGPAMSPARRDAIETGVYESLGMLAFEAAQSVNWTPEDYRARFTFEGDEHWRSAREAGQGVLLVTGHFGNWELMHAAFFCHAAVATGVISRDVTNPALNTKIGAFRGRMGNPIFSNEQSAVRYLRLLRRGGVLAMLADQDSKRLRCTYVEFFGHPASAPIGPGFLSHKCGAPIVPVFSQRLTSDPTRHKIRFYPPLYPNPEFDAETDAWRMMQGFSDCLEQEIRSAPEQWVWVHNRWGRAPRPDERRLLEERMQERK